MPGRPRKIPSYCRHKASGQAVVRINGQDEYLGPYGTPESYERYHRLLAERYPNGLASATMPAVGPAVSGGGDMTIVELIAAYWDHVKAYYVKNGRPTSEQNSIRTALHPLNDLYGHEPCRCFGPLALEAVRNTMVGQGITRKRINQHVGRIRRMFKWAVAKELIPVDAYQALTTLDGLRKGRCGAKESVPIRPVTAEQVEAVLPYLATPVQAMVRLQSKIGCRPGEVTIIRPCDVDRATDPWVYTPGSHKTEHYELERKIPLGTEAQKILAPWLDRPADAYCFCPRESERHSMLRGVQTEGHRIHRRVVEGSGRCIPRRSRAAITRRPATDGLLGEPVSEQACHIGIPISYDTPSPQRCEKSMALRAAKWFLVIQRRRSPRSTLNGISSLPSRS